MGQCHEVIHKYFVGSFKVAITPDGGEDYPDGGWDEYGEWDDLDGFDRGSMGNFYYINSVMSACEDCTGDQILRIIRDLRATGMVQQETMDDINAEISERNNDTREFEHVTAYKNSDGTFTVSNVDVKSERVINNYVDVTNLDATNSAQFDIWGEGYVDYTGSGLGGTNFVGTGPPGDPAKSGLAPIDAIDYYAYIHDAEYYKAGIEGGLLDARFNLDVAEADYRLVQGAMNVLKAYARGDIDPITNYKVSPRTANIAKAVIGFYKKQVDYKYNEKYGTTPPYR